MNNTAQQTNVPFLTDVIDFLRPRIVETHRNDMLKLVVDWVVEELRTYGTVNSTDNVSCTVELHKCRMTVPAEGETVQVYGYQLLLIIQGEQPQHPQVQADCIFALENEESNQIVNLYLPGTRPGTTVQ